MIRSRRIDPLAYLMFGIAIGGIGFWLALGWFIGKLAGAI